MDSELRSKLHSGVPTKNRKHKMINQPIQIPPEIPGEAPEVGMATYMKHQRRIRLGKVHGSFDRVGRSMDSILKMLEDIDKAVKYVTQKEAR